MRKIIVSMTMLMVFACVVTADTIYLRDGSIIKGTFIGFENGSFIIETSRGDHDTYPARYVSRLVMERQQPGPGSRGAYRRTVLDRELDISAKQAWTDTGIDLEQNMEIEITAEGQIKIGERSAQPNGIRNSSSNTSRYPMPDEGLGAIIGKVRYPNGLDSDLFFIGSSKKMNVKADQVGRLYIGINDDYLPDNSGSFRLNIAAARVSSTPYVGSSRTTQRVKTIEVDAKQTWTDTGIDLQRNAWIDITVEGRIKIGERSAGADGIQSNSTSRFPMPDKGLGAVIAKIRYRNDQDSDLFFIGSRIQTNVDSKTMGRLYIGVNDDYLRDNSGSYRVTIRW